ncbi:MAG: hypothetical protein WBZ36_31405 [Candidatus Nitrosopolaris sp.]
MRNRCEIQLEWVKQFETNKKELEQVEPEILEGLAAYTGEKYNRACHSFLKCFIIVCEIF